MVRFCSFRFFNRKHYINIYIINGVVLPRQITKQTTSNMNDIIYIIEIDIQI